MRIIRLQGQAFKRLVAFDISPDEGLVEVRGLNGEGKTSLLDSIMAALGGADAAPVKPIKTGEEFAAIRVTLGDGQPDLVVTKYFDEVGEKLRVETADGAEFKAGQTKLDDLLGRMTFDPLAFARMPAKDQAAELRRLVPLEVDLDELAKADTADVLARRDINRDGKAAKVRAEAINISGIIPERPDRDAIVKSLSTAAETNGAIERDKLARENEARYIRDIGAEVEAKKKRAEELVAEAAELDAIAEGLAKEAGRRLAVLDGMDPVAQPVDTAKLSEDLAKADADLALLGRVDERKRLDEEVEALRAKSEAFTKRLEERAKVRADALAAAKMPVEGLSIAEVEGEMLVTFNGEPFSQSSGAEQLRVSMALAMAANPKLRVMLIKDGSLLDASGLALVRDMAKAGEYQVWLESVGEGDGQGIIMEAGKVRGASDPEPLAQPKRRKAKEDETASDDGAASNASAAQPVAEEGRAITAEPDARPVTKPERPRAMREFTTPAPSQGGLFGGEE